MKAMVINNFGSAEEFTSAEMAKPELKPGHVIVKVMASSVNPVDYKIRELGTNLPFAPQLPAVLGMDFAGVIDSMADDVSGYEAGDEVFGCAGGLGDLAGSLAEYMLVDVRLMARKPKSISMAQAAALPLVSITAYEGLTRAGIQAGQKVLVHGGSGGVGHIAVQLAKHFGAEVYATGGGEAQISLIESLGATGINYKTESVESYVTQYTDNRGFDVIYDSVGELNLLNSIDAATLNGHIATTSSMAEINLTMAHLKGLSLHVVFMLIPMIHDLNRERHGDILNTIASIVDAGELMPTLAEQSFQLSEVAQAHQYLESGAAMGKVVLTHQE